MIPTTSNSLMHHKFVSPEARHPKDHPYGLNKFIRGSPASTPAFLLGKTTQIVTSRNISSGKEGHKMQGLARMEQTWTKDNLGVSHVGDGLRALERVQNVGLESALYIVQTAIKQCMLMQTKLGFCSFSIHNYYISPQNRLVVTAASPMPPKSSSPLQQPTVVREIIESVYKIAAAKVFDDFYFYYKRTSLKNRCDFKYTISLIQSYSSCSKITLKETVEEYRGNADDCRAVLRSVERLSPKKLSKKRSHSRLDKDPMPVKMFRTSQAQPQQPRNKSLLCPSMQNIAFSQQTIAYSQLTIDKKCENTKNSTVSTNIKSSIHPGDISEINISKLGSPMSESYNGESLRARMNDHRHFSLFPIEIDEVQSLGDSSDLQQDYEGLSRRNCLDTPRDSEAEKSKRQNEMKILSMNNWTKKFQGLLTEETDLKQSFTSEVLKQSDKPSDRANARVQNLGRMARTTVRSILHTPAELKMLSTSPLFRKNQTNII